MTHPTKPCPRCGRECMFRGDVPQNHTCVDGRTYAGGELLGEPSVATLRAALHEALDGWRHTAEHRETSWALFEQIDRLRKLAGPRPGKETGR